MTADGNMIARTAGGITTNYTWNDDNRLVAVAKSGTTTQYRYDSEGIRKSKGSDTRYFSSGAMSLADLHPTNSISYVQGHQILGMIQASQFYWYISDALSTVRLVVDGSGTVVASYASDEFGNQTAATGSADLRQHTYTGGLGVRDDGAALGLLYMRQRYYDPSLGKWLSADPIGFAGGLNLYRFVGQSPINFVDPNGLQPGTAGEATWELDPDGNRQRVDHTTNSLKEFGKSVLELYLMIETGKAGWKVACGLKRGLSAAAAKASYTGMRGGGGHAMRHLMEEGLIANKGSLTLRAAEFQRLTLPILRNPSKTFSWKLGDTPSTGYVGMIGGKNVVVFVAKSGKYAGKVIGSFVPDGKQVVQWGIK